MALMVLSTSKRASKLTSISNHNQCGGPKKAGIGGFQGNYVRDQWLGGRAAAHPVNYHFKTCALLKASGKVTMNPVGSGGVGRQTRLTKITFHGNGL